MNDLGRELVLEYEAHINESPLQTEILDEAIKVYREGLRDHPDALIIRFNLIRTIFHYGSPAAVSDALVLVVEVLATPMDRWIIDPLDDVFPWDFHSNYFNYRRYLDAVVEHLQNKDTVFGDLVQTIYASLHHYLACYLKNDPRLQMTARSHYENAVQLDPQFPFYRLSLAKEAMSRGGDSDRGIAVKLLRRLVEESMLFEESYDLLKKLAASWAPARAETDALKQIMSKSNDALICFEQIRIDHLQASDSQSGAVGRSNTGQSRLGDYKQNSATRFTRMMNLAAAMRVSAKTLGWALIPILAHCAWNRVRDRIRRLQK